MKQTLSTILSLTLVLAFFFPLQAHANSTTASAQTAFIYDVNETGSNIGDETLPAPTTATSVLPLSIVCNNNFALTLNTTINNQAITLSCQPAGRSENLHAIYFTATCSNPNYEVIHMAYVDNAEVNMYFKSHCSLSSASQILQVYLRNITSNTRDYVFLEIFDYNFSSFSNILPLLKKNTVMGSWVASEFVPKDTSYTDVFPRVDTRNYKRTFSATFEYYRSEQTHTITLSADCTFSNIPVGQTADIIYRMEIVGKTISCPIDPTQNSSNESFLHVDTLSLRQSTVPNVAFISESIDGIVQNNNISSGNLSAAISVSYGLLNVALSLPSSFLLSTTIDINSTYNSFVNGRDGNYTRAIKTSLADGLKLTQIGYYFEVRCTIGDFGEVVRDIDAIHHATWDIAIINLGNQTTRNETMTQHVPIRIK